MIDDDWYDCYATLHGTVIYFLTLFYFLVNFCYLISTSIASNSTYMYDYEFRLGVRNII